MQASRAFAKVSKKAFRTAQNLTSKRLPLKTQRETSSLSIHHESTHLRARQRKSGLSLVKLLESFHNHCSLASSYGGPAVFIDSSPIDFAQAFCLKPFASSRSVRG